MLVVWIMYIVLVLFRFEPLISLALLMRFFAANQHFGTLERPKSETTENFKTYNRS